MQLTFNLSDKAESLKVAELIGTVHGAARVQSPAATSARPAPSAKPAAKPVKAAPIEDDTEEDGAEDEALTYATVKAKIIELGAVPGTGRASVAAILKKLGVEKGPELEEAQWPKALKMLQAAIDAE